MTKSNPEPPLIPDLQSGLDTEGPDTEWKVTWKFETTLTLPQIIFILFWAIFIFAILAGMIFFG